MSSKTTAARETTVTATLSEGRHYSRREDKRRNQN